MMWFFLFLNVRLDHTQAQKKFPVTHNEGIISEHQKKVKPNQEIP